MVAILAVSRDVVLGSIVDLGRGETWDGGRLAAEVERRAALLAARGIGPGSRVAILHGGSAGFFADLLAVWHRGACAACLNAGAAPSEVRNVVAFVEPDALLLHGPHEAAAALAPPCLDLAAETGRGEPAPDTEVAGDAPALMLFTSGTTGAPKAVVHTYGSLGTRLALNRRHLGEDVLDRTLCLLPTHFGHGLIGNSLTPLLAGKTLVLSPGGIAAAAGLGATLDAERVTFLSSVPALWKLALKVSPPPQAGTLLQIGIGSAPLSAELWRAVIAWTGTRNVVNMYGITEAANWIAGASGAEHEPEDGLIGTPWGGAMAVRDTTGHVQATGAGELLVRSPALMQGYDRRDDLTAQVLEDGWYRTGDVGTIDADGVARLTGRIRHEINRAGMKIHPEDIDLLLERHPAVVEACAFGVPDEVSGEEVAVAVRCADGAEVSTEALRAWCAERIRAEAVPRAWYRVAAIPKTDRGKINRDTVRAHCLGAEA